MNSLGFQKKEKDTRVVVAMSGGVDSSVVAVMLKKQGYEVIGITLQLYDHGAIINNKKSCCAGLDIKDAKNIALEYDFSHYVLDYEGIFKESVIEDFADSYLRGETPIPCVKCNQSVKFKDLFKVAKDLGADCLVTGHYVQRILDNKEIKMLKGIDQNKDQSYFLFATTKNQLDFLRFPLGDKTKKETRKIAKEFDIKIADKPDSQDICFVPDGNYQKVINKIRPTSFKSGDIIDLSGNILGKHDGIINYTIGQRKGLGISNKEPLYVVKIDPKKNQVTVGYEHDLLGQEFAIKELNWLGNDDIFNNEIEFEVKLRSVGNLQKAIIKADKNNQTAIIKMVKSARAITKGQACVIYDGDRVMGGGWINEVMPPILKMVQYEEGNA
jgi:tRNA-uridine 2-sulfurtransferase